MDPTLVNPTTIIGLFAAAAFVLRALVDWRALRAVPAGKECLTREEYDRDEKARKAQHRAVVLRCRHNARRHSAFRRDTEGKFARLLEKLTELQVQFARVATCMEQREGIKDPTEKET